MKKILMILISTMLLLALGAANVLADEYKPSELQPNNGEPYLTAILDHKFGSGNYYEVTNTNEYEFDPGTYVTTVLEDKHAAYKDPTGWYASDTKVLNVLYTDPQAQLANNEVTRHVTAGGSKFGLYIKSDDGNTYYSKASLNPDKSMEPNYGKHVRLFVIKEGADKGAYVLGFEDLRDNSQYKDHSDWDYNDVVVELKGANLSIPEFPTAALPVAAILGLVVITGRKKEKL
jgi:hypothetical protein